MTLEIPQVVSDIAQRRKTGELVLNAAGRQSALLFEEGNWVGIRSGFGHLTQAQCLALDGVLDLPALDRLWFESEVPQPHISLQPLLRLCQLAESTEWMETTVEAQFAPQTLFEDLTPQTLELTPADIATVEELGSREEWPFEEGAMEGLGAFAQGQVAMKRRDFRAAESFFFEACQHQPKPEYLAARAWSVYCDPFRPGEHESAKRWMEDCLKADGHCHAALYQLGLVANLEGKLEDAERYFASAVGVRPTHLESHQALRAVSLKKNVGNANK